MWWVKHGLKIGMPSLEILHLKSGLNNRGRRVFIRGGLASLNNRGRRVFIRAGLASLNNRGRRFFIRGGLANNVSSENKINCYNQLYLQSNSKSEKQI